MALFKLPRLKANLAIVDGQGRPTDFFLRLFNIDFAQRIEANENSQNQTLADLTAAFAAIQTATAIAQAAQQSANEAMTGGVSGSAYGTADPIPTVWTPAVTVNLTGVTAGNLTIPGTGPQQDDAVERPNKGATSGQFRVVEVVSGVDTVLFTGNFTVYNNGDGDPPTVSNSSISDVAAFSAARTSTGAVDYRLDIRTTTSGDVFFLSNYLYVRRS